MGRMYGCPYRPLLIGRVDGQAAHNQFPIDPGTLIHVGRAGSSATDAELSLDGAEHAQESQQEEVRSRGDAARRRLSRAATSARRRRLRG